jgi:protein-S-isoprenylcysteine O-methyltransferase Ste14
MTTVSIQPRPDFGRILMVPAAAVMLVLDVTALTHGSQAGGAMRWAGAALVCAFYALIIWCYLRRGRAVATSGSITGYAAAVAATLIPFTLPLLHGASPGPAHWGGVVGPELAQYAGYLLVVAGTGWAVWSVRFLGRSISVIAQAREVVAGGPYRLVRHPLYLGEIISGLGVTIVVGSVWACCAWVTLCLLQAYRALREEQVLLQALPGYRSYRARTAALLPGVF